MAPVKTPPVHFHFLCPFSLSHRRSLKAFISGIFKKEKVKLGEVNYIFCSDKYLLDINRQYLQHDFFTDIITFNLADKGGPILGEIYISIDRVRENARDHSVSFQQEIHRVIFHGILHLCGYNDKTKDQIKKMRAREDYYLKKYFGR